jgi:NAD(P)-dependent dehydrogenase (short-subunit alcohol dehydrogenase family)
MSEARNLVWVTGATSGIGASLAARCPWPDTNVVSVSRRPHPEYETVPFDLSDQASWNTAAAAVAERLASFQGERAVFVHNALFHTPNVYAGEGEHEAHVEELVANCVGAIALGDAFLRAAIPASERGVDVGLVMMSSATARVAYPGFAIYSAAKAAIEQWVRCVRAERADRGTGPWAVAVRPGFVDTPGVRRNVEQPPDTHPGVPGMVEALRTGQYLTPDDCADLIWGALPEAAHEKAVLLFGEAVGVTGQSGPG